MTEAQSRTTARQRNAKIVRCLRNTSLTLEAVGAEFGLTRQRIQQIAKGAGITWERRRRAIISRMGNERGACQWVGPLCERPTVFHSISWP